MNTLAREPQVEMLTFQGSENAQMKVEVVEGKKPYLVLTMKSMTDGEKEYRVDVTKQRCSCGAWKFQKNADGIRRPCKHLKALGFGGLQ